jgi:thioredoxin-like negative regulator of GroEL
VQRQAKHGSTIQLPVELRPSDEQKPVHAVSERLGVDTVWLTLAKAVPEGSTAKVFIETPFGPVAATGKTTAPAPARLGGETYFVQACQLQSVPSESQLVLKKTLREDKSSRLGRIIRYSPEKMDLPTLRPGTLLGTTAAVAAAIAIVANLWILKDDILVARALANGKVTAEELEQLAEIKQRLINDPAPNEQRVLRVREVMRVLGNSEGLREMDEFLASADFASFRGRLTRAQALDELGEHEAAGELLAQLLQQRAALTDQDMRSELLISAARNMTNRAEYQRASDFLDELEATGADISRYRLERVSVLGALGEIEQVEEILGGTNVRADRTRLASILSANQRFDRAAETYLDIADDNPDDSDALAMAANNAVWGGRFETAAYIYARLLERDNSDHSIQTRFAQACLWADQPDQALPVLSQLIQRDQATQEEAQLFLEAVAACDTVDEVHRQLVLQIYNEREDYLDQLVFIKRLADAMSRIGENEAAIPILEFIVESEETNHAMRLRLAEALRAAGSFEEAEMHFQRLLADSDPVH